jgi:predicted ArsR family transcriptional regulator
MNGFAVTAFQSATHLRIQPAKAPETIQKKPAGRTRLHHQMPIKGETPAQVKLLKALEQQGIFLSQSVGSDMLVASNRLGEVLSQTRFRGRPEERVEEAILQGIRVLGHS